MKDAMNKTTKRAVVFDLDGTLIDSAPDIRTALNRTLALHELAPLGADEIKSMIGDGAKVLVERGFAARGRTATAADQDTFLTDYEANSAVETVPYPGMVEALAALQRQGHKMAVCTNKPAGAARAILAALGLEDFFAVVTGGDSTPFRKPDPRHLAAALDALGTADAVMVGDHHNDMAAARGMEIPAIFVSWGYGAADAAHIAHHALELPGIIAAL
jgi:phosphoglycolate phosphatase